MALFNRGGKAWRFLSLAVIAIPWFLRDQLAVSLDRHTQTAQKVVEGLHTEKQRQLRDHEQRDNSQRLKRIEINVQRLAKSSTDQQADEAMTAATVKEFHDEAEALAAGAGEFKNLLSEVSLDPSRHQALAAAADAALATAASVAKDVQPGTDEKTLQALLGQFDQAADKLEAAFETLHGAADQERADSARWADGSRFAAWVLTALGMLMIGDWRKAVKLSLSEEA